jgi:hypothetical protein
MANHTDGVLSECEKDVVFALDVIDGQRELFHTHVPFTEQIANCDCGPLNSRRLERWVNKRRRQAGKAELAEGTVKPSSTIREVIDHVC